MSDLPFQENESNSVATNSGKRTTRSSKNVSTDENDQAADQVQETTSRHTTNTKRLPKRSVIKIGDEHQAVIPSIEDFPPPSPSTFPLKSMEAYESQCLWIPVKSEELPHLGSFLRQACIDYNYNEEQSLLIYYICGGKLEYAKEMMAAFVPYRDTWSDAEKSVLLTAAYFHKKNFIKIRDEHLKDRSMQEIIEAYYATKRRAPFIYGCTHLSNAVREYYLYKCRSREKKNGVRSSAIANSSGHIPSYIRIPYECAIYSSRHTGPTLTRTFLGTAEDRRLRYQRRQLELAKLKEEEVTADSSQKLSEPSRKQIRLENTEEAVNGSVVETMSTVSQASSDKELVIMSRATSSSVVNLVSLSDLEIVNTLPVIPEESQPDETSAPDSNTRKIIPPAAVPSKAIDAEVENNDDVISISSSSQQSGSSSSLQAENASNEDVVQLMLPYYGFTGEDQIFLMETLWSHHDKLLREDEYDSRPPRSPMESSGDNEPTVETLTKEQDRILRLLSNPPSGWEASRDAKLFNAIFRSKGISFVYRFFRPRNFTFRLPRRTRENETSISRELDFENRSQGGSSSGDMNGEKIDISRDDGLSLDNSDKETDSDGKGTNSPSRQRKSSRLPIHPVPLNDRLTEQLWFDDATKGEKKVIPVLPSPPPGAMKMMLIKQEDDFKDVKNLEDMDNSTFTKRLLALDEEYARLEKANQAQIATFRTPSSKVTAKWESYEVQVLLIGIHTHGFDFEKLSEFVMSKTPTQIMHFVQKYSQKLDLERFLSHSSPSRSSSSSNVKSGTPKTTPVRRKK